jgi:hypothetical protein
VLGNDGHGSPCHGGGGVPMAVLTPPGYGHEQSPGNGLPGVVRDRAHLGVGSAVGWGDPSFTQQVAQPNHVAAV